jgi:quinol monooxygenase YgiN
VIIIAGSLSFDPSDRHEVLEGLRSVTEFSRMDRGCVEYSWAEDLESPNVFRFFECWESQDLFDAHLAIPHEKDFGERFLSRITGATARLYSATDAEEAPH